jgi:hypothetical protein
MTTPHPVLPILLALAATATAAAAPESTVRFANNDVLTGTPESLSPALLVWKSPLLEESAAFHLDKVLEMSMPGGMSDKPADHEAVVTLTNGDTIRGQLASVDDETVSLDTWFAGRMTFKRVMVTGLVIEEKTDFLYRGPTGMDGWIQPRDSSAWKYERAAFRSSAAGGIARDDVLSDECVISFDTAWKGDSIRMRVILFSDDPETDNPSTGYELSFQRGSVHLRNAKTQSFLGSAQSQALMESDRARVEIRASRKSNRIALTINDRIVEVWNDPDARKADFGKALHFISGSPQPLRISNIRVAPWDGVIDKMPEPQLGFGAMRFGLQPGIKPKTPPPPAAEKSKEERMELANGDSLTGEVTSIRDGTIAIKTPLGDVSLPVSRLRSLALKPVEAERSIRRNGDVRAWFPDGSSIVFRLDECGDGTLTGSSQNFGSATFDLSAFTRIEFNIYSRAYEELRGKGEW